MLHTEGEQTMAIQSQVDMLLNQDVLTWNNWRFANPGVFIDLSGADLHGAHLTLADLNGANLSRADLHGANLTNAPGTTPAQLAQARSLQGTTMPDGSKHS